MRKLFVFVSLLFCAVFSSACIHTLAVQELNEIAAKYLDEGDPSSAISRLESSIDLDPNVYESHYNLAVAYVRVNQCEKAVQQAEIANKLIKDEPAINYTLGVAYDCAAHALFEKRNDDNEIEEIKYTNPADEYSAGIKFIDYSQKANKNYIKYISILPAADDASEVSRLITQNDDKLSEMKVKYNQQ